MDGRIVFHSTVVFVQTDDMYQNTTLKKLPVGHGLGQLVTGGEESWATRPVRGGDRCPFHARS